MRCAFCHDDVPHLWTCPRCGAVLHRDCLGEAARCTSIGCGGRPAPVRSASPFRAQVRSGWRRLAAGALAGSLLGIAVWFGAPRVPAALAVGDEPVAATDLLAQQRLLLQSQGGPEAARRLRSYLVLRGRWSRAHGGHTAADCGACAQVDEAGGELAEAWGRLSAFPEPPAQQGIQDRADLDRQALAGLDLAGETREQLESVLEKSFSERFVQRVGEWVGEEHAHVGERRVFNGCYSDWVPCAGCEQRRGALRAVLEPTGR